MSERVAWLEALMSVVFEAFVWGLVAKLDITDTRLDVITYGIDTQQKKYKAIFGYLILGVVLLLSQHIAAYIWERRLLSTKKHLVRAMRKHNSRNNLQLEEKPDVHTTNELHKQSGSSNDIEISSASIEPTALEKSNQAPPVNGLACRRDTPLMDFFSIEKYSLHNFHREYMKKHTNYFRVVIVYVMCTAYYSVAKINVDVRHNDC
eukprot:CAMPEP_0185759076 /NCGR_PEP_ID=MMETSP1174-20130828/17782_1 /TAXON_ID=35687 /ORGANISM="Dictyocha speculum, Strain CCMP1381" /LENGTH=205 /DNA_ID=CAMNT_0028439239 /DNA_START=468 /DNA_END=1085 /DNA_ORIENTATION=-